MQDRILPCKIGEYLKGDTVRLKKYFYVLRPILACRWILSEGTPPPMLFRTLMDKLSLL
ncbi:MAG: nucleotidyltransferase domain-containing protein [Clostridia bacterium]|nr:nucleotidyltransferase domain-containing protein [Clostridia bacterium]